MPNIAVGDYDKFERLLLRFLLQWLLFRLTSPMFTSSFMISVVLGFNLLLASMCFYIAWQMSAWRQALAAAADTLIEVERATHEVLNGAPTGIMQGQISTDELRQSYRQLTLQMRHVQKIMNVFTLGGSLWSGRRVLSPARLAKNFK
jgi:Zn-dependent protease with chaperone function